MEYVSSGENFLLYMWSPFNSMIHTRSVKFNLTAPILFPFPLLVCTARPIYIICIPKRNCNNEFIIIYCAIKRWPILNVDNLNWTEIHALKHHRT